MSVIQIGIVDRTQSIDPHFLQEAAAASNIQVLRDLTQYWSIQATVRVLPDPKKVPVGIWPVFLVKQLPPGEGGVHLDKNNQPYALVIANSASTDWTLDASHEIIEMLVDPAGNRMHSSRAITIQGNDVVDAPGEFGYLVEACDPCEANKYAYAVHGIAVSDFITPHFYDPVVTKGTRYSFTGALTRPRQILPGGYISYNNPAKDRWEQIIWLDKKPILKDLGPATGRCLRAFVDGITSADVARSRKPNRELAKWTATHRGEIHASSELRGAYFASLMPAERGR